MSFTFDIINELTECLPEKTCCKKAFLFGLFFCAEKISPKDLQVEFKTEESANAALTILKKQFSAEPIFEPIVRAGRKMFRVTVYSKPLLTYIDRIDNSDDVSMDELEKIVGLVNHAECKKYFLAGVFITSGTATDPEKRYSLEFGVKSEIRALWLSAFLSKVNGAPSYIERATRRGLYYKGNEKICDILVYMGANNSFYTVFNAYAVHLIKNQENRATNCVMKNIEKSVATARKQIEAIDFIKVSGRFDSLSEELQYTARLRCEYDSATLSELALLHEPPISKSGLNRRLEKLLIIADSNGD